MKSYDDKKLLLTLLGIAIFAGLSGRWLETMHFEFPENPAGIGQAAALLATEQNLAPVAPPQAEIQTASPSSKQ